MKERIGAIFIGLIMLFSVVGFALVSVIPDQPTTPEIPHIYNGEMSGSDIVFLLQNGRTIFRYYYDSTSQNNLDEKITLEIFANKVKDFVVLNEIESNTTKLEIVGVVNGEGKIIDFEGEITEENLFIELCERAYVKPKECYL